MDILTNIHNHLGTLSRGKRRIAQYLLESAEQAAFQTAAVIGKTVGVSESTVVRFAVDLGYDGYPELQKALQEMVRTRWSDAPQGETARTAQGDLIDSVLRAEMEQLHRTMKELDRRAFCEAAEILLEARCIYVMGAGNSALLADGLFRSLQMMLEDVRCVTGGGEWEILCQLLRISPADALFCVTFGSDSAQKAMEFAQQSGAKVIVLTDRETEYADTVLRVKRNKTTLADSMVAPLSVIYALIAELSSRRRQKTAEIMERLEEIRDVYHV